MSDFVASATAILSASERRLETVAGNVANISTAGYKRQVSFSELVADAAPGIAAAPAVRVRADLAEGRLSETGNPLDLAIGGPGFFRLRADEGYFYSRQGQFRLDDEGRVVTPQGHALQQADGSDLLLDRAEVEILADGTVLDDGRPVARIAVYAPGGEAAVEPVSGSLLAIAGDAIELAEPGLRQGMVEASNVALADEMVAMMAAMRQAETGARLIQVYDELIGRAVTTFGQAGR